MRYYRIEIHQIKIYFRKTHKGNYIFYILGPFYIIRRAFLNKKLISNINLILRIKEYNYIEILF